MPAKSKSDSNYEELMSDTSGIDTAIEGFESEQNDDDPDILKLQLIDKIVNLLLVKHQKLDKQISRLSEKEIFKLVLMEATDDIIQLPFYRPFAENLRIHKISLNGGGRKELIELAKSMTENEGYGMPYQEETGLGIRGKIRKFIKKDY